MKNNLKGFYQQSHLLKLMTRSVISKTTATTLLRTALRKICLALHPIKYSRLKTLRNHNAFH